MKIEQLEIEREGLRVQKTSLESSKTYSQKVLDEAIPSNIACVAAGLRTAAENLKDLKIVPVEKNSVVSFAPSFDLNDLFTTKNIIGEINISGKRSCNYPPISSSSVNVSNLHRHGRRHRHHHHHCRRCPPRHYHHHQ